MQIEAVLGSPSRVTRSQLRRMSAISEIPSSPSTRRTTRSRHSIAGGTSEDSDAASIQSEPGGGIRTRRTTRASSQQPRSPPKVEIKRTRRSSLSTDAPVSVRSTRSRPRLSPVPSEETSPAKLSPKPVQESPKSPKNSLGKSPRRLFSHEQSPKELSPVKDSASIPKVVVEDVCIPFSEPKRLSLRSPRLAMKSLQLKLDMVSSKTGESETVNSDKAVTPKAADDVETVDASPKTPGSVEDASPKTPESGALKGTRSGSQTPVGEGNQVGSPRRSPLAPSEKGVTPQTPVGEKCASSRNQTPQARAENATTPQTRSQTPLSESGKETASPQTCRTSSQTPVSESKGKSAPQTPQEKDSETSRSRNQTPQGDREGKIATPQSNQSSPANRRTLSSASESENKSTDGTGSPCSSRSRNQTPQGDREGKIATPQSNQSSPANRRTRSSASESENKLTDGTGSPCSTPGRSQSRTQSESGAKSETKSDGLFKTPVGTPPGRSMLAEAEQRGSPSFIGSPARLSARWSGSNSEIITNVIEEETTAVRKATGDVDENGGNGDDSNDLGLKEDEESLESSDRSAEGETLSMEEEIKKKNNSVEGETTECAKSKGRGGQIVDVGENVDAEKETSESEESETVEDGKNKENVEDEREKMSKTAGNELQVSVTEVSEEESDEMELVEPKKIAVTEETDEDSDGEAVIAEVQEIEEEDGTGLETEDEETGKNGAIVLEVEESGDEDDGAAEKEEASNGKDFLDLEAEDDNPLGVGDDDEEDEDEDEEEGFVVGDDDEEEEDDEDSEEKEDVDEDLEDEEDVEEDLEDEEDVEEDLEDEEDVDYPKVEVSKPAKSPVTPAVQRTSQGAEGSDVVRQKPLNTPFRSPVVSTKLANTPISITPTSLKPFNADNQSKSDERRQKKEDPSRRKSDDGRFSALSSLASKNITPTAQKKESLHTSFTASLSGLSPSSSSNSESLDTSEKASSSEKSQDVNQIRVPEITFTSPSPTSRVPQPPKLAAEVVIGETKTTVKNKRVKEERSQDSDYDFDLLDNVPETKVSPKNRFQVRDISFAPGKSGLESKPKCKLTFVVRDLTSTSAAEKVSTPARKTGLWNIKPIKKPMKSLNRDEEATMKSKKKKKFPVGKLESQVNELIPLKKNKKKRAESFLDVDDLRHKLSSSGKTASSEKKTEIDSHMIVKTKSVEVISGSRDGAEKSKKHKKSNSMVLNDGASKLKKIDSLVPLESNVSSVEKGSKSKKNKKSKHAVEETSSVTVPDKFEKLDKKKRLEISTSDNAERKRKALLEDTELVNFKTKKARTEEKVERKSEDSSLKSDVAGLDKKKKKKLALQEKLQKELQRHKKSSAQSDDDAPTAMSFSDSRQFALDEELKKKTFLEEKEKLKREKKKLKLQRMLEQRAQQVKRKAEYELEDSFEPSEASAVPKGKKTYFDDASNKPCCSKSLDKAASKPGTEEKLSSKEKKLAERERKRREKGLAELLKRRKMAGASFIPVEAPSGSTRFGVVPLKNLNNDGNRLAECPSDFRSQMLYGNRVNRVSNNVYQSQKEKSIAGGASSSKHLRWD